MPRTRGSQHQWTARVVTARKAATTPGREQIRAVPTSTGPDRPDPGQMPPTARWMGVG